jgi:phage terminase large subunit-like protein
MTAPDESWAPLYYTKPLTENFVSRGDDVIDIAETFIVAERGRDAGEKFKLVDWQKWLLRAIYEEKPDGTLRYRIVVIGMPRKNGKTQSILAPAVLERLVFGGRKADCASIGAVRKNALDLYEFIEDTIAASPFLKRHIKVKQDGMRSRMGAKYAIFAADKSSRMQGQSKDLLTIDEFHEFITPKQIGAFQTARSGQGDRVDESLIIITSTAGENLESKLGEMFQMGIKASQGLHDDDSFGFFWWGAPADADYTDPAVWRAANPSLGEGLLSEDFLRGQLKEKDASGNLNEFLRYHLNIWCRTEGEEYISPHHWDLAKVEGAKIEKGSRIAVGFDGSLDNDSTAFVGIDLDTGVIEVLAAWHKDMSDPNWVVPRDEVLSEKERIFREYDVATLYADTAYWKTEIQQWSVEHYPKVVDLKQGSHRMAEIYADFKKEVIGKVLTHNGDAKLSEHVQNAVMKRNGVIGKEAWKSPKKIDLCVAAAFAAEGRRIAIERDAQNANSSFGFY